MAEKFENKQISLVMNLVGLLQAGGVVGVD